MIGLEKILPFEGRWQPGGLTEGCDQLHHPSTILRMVPLPCEGRN